MAYKRKKKEFFFQSVYMKMNWTFKYLKVMRRINQYPERKKERKKKESKNIFPFIFFSICIYENELIIYLLRSYRWLVPAKFVDVLVHMRYFLAVKYKHKLWGKFFSVWEKTAPCLTLAVQWDVKIKLRYSQNFRKWFER